MRSNVKTIKLTTRLSLILAVITYLISIKGVLGLDEIKWLPDTFLFVVVNVKRKFSQEYKSGI